MNFKLWKRQKTRTDAPLLEAICPKIRNPKFPEMAAAIRKAVSHAKRRMDSNGAPAAAILFSEGENYRFTITHDEAMEEVERMQRLLPGGYLIAAAFNVLEDHGENLACNNGYLITHDSIQHSPKRSFTELERKIIGNIYTDAYLGKWEQRSMELETGLAKFPCLDFGAGFRMEHRVCADVCASPIYLEPQTITLVSADGNATGYYVRLQPNRMAVITNDAEQPTPMICRSNGAEWKGAAERDFNVISVFESKMANPLP